MRGREGKKREGTGDLQFTFLAMPLSKCVENFLYTLCHCAHCTQPHTVKIDFYITKYFVAFTKLFGNYLLTKNICELHQKIWSMVNKMYFVIITKWFACATKQVCEVNKNCIGPYYKM